MSDLHQAVQAEIAAHTPSRPPSFDALKARKRSRDRRRTIAAVTASALAAAGMVFVPSALGGSSEDNAPARVAGAGADEVFGFGIKATDAETATAEGGGGPEALKRCLELPGLSGVTAQYSYPGQYSGRVTGRGNADAFKSCVDAVPGWAATLTPVGRGAGTQTYTVRPSVRLVLNSRLEEERDACFALPGVNAVGQGESQPVIYRVTVDLGESLAFEQCIGKVGGLYVPELGQANAAAEDGGIEWTGVKVCRLAAPGEVDCQFFGEQEAEALDDALLTATLAPEGQAYCDALTPAYTVQFDHPSVRAIQITVRVGCGPMEKGNQDYLLPAPAQELVQQTHAGAGTGPSAQAFIRRCVAPMGELPSPAPGYVGKDEVEFTRPDGSRTLARVIGRDGTCLDRTSDYQPERADLLVVRGKIIWASLP